MAAGPPETHCWRDASGCRSTWKSPCGASGEEGQEKQKQAVDSPDRWEVRMPMNAQSKRSWSPLWGMGFLARSLCTRLIGGIEAGGQVKRRVYDEKDIDLEVIFVVKHQAKNPRKRKCPYTRPAGAVVKMEAVRYEEVDVPPIPPSQETPTSPRHKWLIKRPLKEPKMGRLEILYGKFKKHIIYNYIYIYDCYSLYIYRIHRREKT